MFPLNGRLVGRFGSDLLPTVSLHVGADTYDESEPVTSYEFAFLVDTGTDSEIAITEQVFELLEIEIAHVHTIRVKTAGGTKDMNGCLVKAKWGDLTQSVVKEALIWEAPVLAIGTGFLKGAIMEMDVEENAPFTIYSKAETSQPSS